MSKNCSKNAPSLAHLHVHTLISGLLFLFGFKQTSPKLGSQRTLLISYMSKSKRSVVCCNSLKRKSGENYFKLGQRKQCHVAIFSVIIIMYWTGFLFYKIKHCSNLQLVTVVQQTPEVEARPENTKQNKTIRGMIQDEGL